MTKTIIFLESNKGGHVMAGIRAAHNLGLRAHFMCRQPAEYSHLRPTPMELADNWTCVETFNPRDLLAAGQEVAAHHDVVGVAAFDDYRVLPAARLRAALNIEHGPTPEAIATCRDKSATREALAKTPYSVQFETVNTRISTVSPVGYPCVVKPIDETGSASVRLCAHHEDFQAACDAIASRAARSNSRGFTPSTTALVEEAVHGEEFSAEMAWSHDEGIWRVLGYTHKHVTRRDAIIESGHTFPHTFGTDREKHLDDALRSVLGTVGLTSTYAHVEFIVSGSRLAIVEINPRPGGGRIAELMELSRGINPFAAHVAAHAGLRSPVPVGGIGVAAVRFLVPPATGRIERISLPSPLPSTTCVSLADLPFDVAGVDSNDYRAGSITNIGMHEADVDRVLDDIMMDVRYVYEAEGTPDTPQREARSLV